MAQAFRNLRLKPFWLPPYWSRLDAYIFSELNYPFWLSMSVYNGIFFIMILSDVSEIGSGQFDIPLKLFIILFLSRIPEILFLTTTISFLSGSLFAMRRLSMDSEIIMPQSLGLSFWRINRSLLVFGFLLSSAMFAINNYAGPYLVRLAEQRWAQFLEKDAFPNISEGMNPLGRNAVMYVDHVADDKLAGMVIISRQESIEDIYLAQRASLYTTREVNLLDWVMCTISLNNTEGVRVLDGKTLSKRIPIPTELRGKNFKNGPEQLLSTQQLRQAIEKAGADVKPDMLYIYYDRIISPALFLILALFAIPLAARHARLNSGSGIGVSLFMIGMFFMAGKMAKDMMLVGKISAFWAVTLPLLAFGLVGLILQVGKNLWWSQYWRKNQGRVAHFFDRMFKAIVGWIRAMVDRIRGPNCDSGTGRSTSQTFLFPSKLDIYTMRSFFSIFFTVQLSFLLLFVLVDFTQISGFLRKRSVPGEIVFSYFLNKIPSIVDDSLFLGLLIAVLILFTMMSKNQEIVAIRAGGGSLQRLCLPLVFCGILISCASYYLQNNFLPYTNRNAQVLRNTIRDKTEPIFTSNLWMRGASGDILNYAYFDSEHDKLVGVTRYQISGEGQTTLIRRNDWPILKHVKDLWELEKPANELTIDLAADKVSRVAIPTGESVQLELTLGDLRMRKQKAGEFSIGELQRYIRYLKNLGYEEAHFQTELYAKYARPLMPLFMMLLAMPLGIQVGRKGTTHGVGIGLGTGLLFMVFFELFKKLGGSGWLNPLVAAWGVIVIFGFVAIYRFIDLE